MPITPYYCIVGRQTELFSSNLHLLLGQEAESQTLPHGFVESELQGTPQQDLTGGILVLSLPQNGISALPHLSLRPRVKLVLI